MTSTEIYTAIAVDWTGRVWCGLREDGSIYCYPATGQWVVPPPSGSGYKAIARAENGYALTASGELVTWGLKDIDNLPLGSYESVVSRSYMGCVLDAEGVPSCWKASGVLNYHPPLIPLLQVATGDGMAAWLEPDGTARFQHGDCGDCSQYPPPGCDLGNWCESGATTTLEGTFTQISRSINICGLDPEGYAHCWQRNGAPMEPAPPDEVLTAIAVAHQHACGLRPDGEITCWGDADSVSLTMPAGPYQAVYAGSFGNCGHRVDGRLTCCSLDPDSIHPWP